MKTSLQGLDTSAIREGYEPKPSATAKGRRSVKSSNSGFFAWMIPTGGGGGGGGTTSRLLQRLGIENRELTLLIGLRSLMAPDK